jgi:hypothetical protein
MGAFSVFNLSSDLVWWLSTPPNCGVATAVKHAENHDATVFQAKKDAIRETAGNDAPDIAICDRTAQRVFGGHLCASFYLGDKRIPQAFAFVFVPCTSLGKFRTRRAMKRDR